MAKNIDDPTLYFLPLDKATVPIDGHVHCRKNRYWIYKPYKGILFYDHNKTRNLIDMSAQCNNTFKVMERIRRDLYPWAEILFLPLVFTPTERR